MTKSRLATNGVSHPELCEAVPADILLPVAAGRVRFYPLDESGQRRAAVPVEGHGGKTLLHLSPQHRTMWYEVEVR